MRVGEYIAPAARRPWAWGTDDCCTFAAGWVLERGLPDPMAFIRGSYDTARGALRSIKEGGGMLPLWRRGMADAGIEEATEPDEGALGVLLLPLRRPVGMLHTVGLYTGTKWVMRMRSGIHATPDVTVQAVWRL